MGGVRGVSDPVSFLRQELTRLGFSTGELVQPHDNPAEPRLNFSPGHWYGTYSFWPFANCSTPGATATLTGIGEVCEVVTAGPSAAFSISIDGGAPYVVPQRADVAGPVVTRVEGLTKGEHTVVVSLVDPGTMYLAAVGFVPSSGVVVQNAGYSGSTTEDWRDEQFGRGRILFQSSNVAPDAIVIELGCNDWNAGVDQATFRSRLDSIVARAQGTGATVLLAVSHFSENGAATWPPYVKTIYDIADARDLALLDLSDRLGYYHERNANGASYDLSSDSTHLTPAGNAVKAEAWLDLLGL
jgi:lysophospholipase L1-like esterase